MPFYDAIRVGAAAAGDYEIERSLKFNKSDNPVLTRSPSSTTDSTKQTLSFWFKISSLIDATNQGVIFAGGSDGSYAYVQFYSNTFYFGNSAGPYWYGTLTLRDFSAWYHAVIVIDTTQSTANDRQKLYINGVQQERGGGSNPSEDANYEFLTNSSWTYYIGKRAANDMNFDGYMAEVNFVQGLALTPSSFAKTDALTGQWIPKKYGGSYGTNGFYLNFSDNSGTTATTLGKDSSGNSNNWTPNNFSVAAGTGNDSLTDTPTNNFCTLNPLDKTNDASLREGALTLYTDSNDQAATGTFGITSGKWYWELDKNTLEPEVGIAHFQMPLSAKGTSVPSDGQIAFIVAGADSNTNFLRVNGSTTTGTGMSAQTGTGSIGIALDMDNKKIWWSDLSGNYFNSGNPATGANAQVDFSSTGKYPNGVTPFVSIYQGAGETTSMNFGQRPFTHTAPTGFKTLCTANLPDPTIAEGNKHFDTLLWTGNSTDNRAITGLNFQPDFTWIKRRSGGAMSHFVVDALRSNTDSGGGNGNNGPLAANLNDAESAQTDGGFESFNSDGFTLGKGSSTANADAPYQRNNASGQTYAGWNWNAGGSTVTNNDGATASQVRANPSAGFSIVSYTGTGDTSETYGHGLGVKPDCIIVKCRNTAGQDWVIYHKELNGGSSPAERIIKLNTTAAEADIGDVWYDTEPTSSVFTVGDEYMVNGSASLNYIAYCFSGVEGFSKFGSYTGNGNANGTFVHTGFRVSWLMVKKYSGTDSWLIMDNKRDIDNVVGNTLAANSSGTENADTGGIPTDFLSNGFKCRGSGGDYNGNGQTYIYLAFAESPFKYARAR